MCSVQPLFVLWFGSTCLCSVQPLFVLWFGSTCLCSVQLLVVLWFGSTCLCSVKRDAVCYLVWFHLSVWLEVMWPHKWANKTLVRVEWGSSSELVVMTGF